MKMHGLRRSAAVKEERQQADRESPDEPSEDWLARMPEAELRQLLRHIPRAMLERLRSKAARTEGP